MKNRRSYPYPGSSSFQVGEALPAVDDGKGKSTRAGDARKHAKKNYRSPSPVSGCDGLGVAEVATTGAWTGEKKTKIQSSPSSATITRDDGGRSDKIVHVAYDEQDWLKQIEGFDWDDDKLREETNYYLERLDHSPSYDDWYPPDEKQLTELNTRLALYRIRAYKGEEILDENQLRDPVALRRQGYYKWCEYKFEWFFDPHSFVYAGLQDYQRLMLRSNGEYECEKWDSYLKLRSTLEGDQQYVKFWEKLSGHTKWIEKTLGGTPPHVWAKLERLAFYQAVKIAADFPQIYSTLIFSGFTEYMWSVEYDKIYYQDYAWLYLEIWKRVAKEKMDLKGAVKQISEGHVPIGCSVEIECELNNGLPGIPGPVTQNYATFVAGISGEVGKPKMYYDYAKKKLEIAGKIGVIDHETKQK
ncbi:hypothetical protein EJB05_04011 [Eragrostis curvula]|uniref:Uncharacterized protein n=1 Tax=Eragrostis curvula TaxID=38414 RepID=A0A5J9W997_9POAL|nr:hypothetical protein EJB05_04011 [Eragrostis curvula]